MILTLPELPYARDALAPHMSAETLDVHHGKHHRTYVETGNTLIAGTEYERMRVEDIIRQASGKVFNNVAQAWNHSFFWNCLSPESQSPSPALKKRLDEHFGSVDAFMEQFTKTAAETFGSGWAWLVRDTSGALRVLSTANAGNPLREGHTPLLTCDVWEHAYYIDYRNARAEYLKHFWNLVNWRFVEQNLG